MGYILGQIVPHKPRQIIAEGDPRWHCLFTRQQSESAAVKRLAALGIEAFYPVTERSTTHRGKTRVIQSRYLPGYVFARFPGDPVWHELWPACTFITDVLRLRSGSPGIIRHADLTNIMAMRATDQEQDRARKARSLIRRGDRVRLRTSPLGEEVVVEVHTLVTVRGKARGKFDINLFGSTVPGEADIDDMERVA